MLIAVVSDTHRDSQAIERVLGKISQADVLIHLGDNECDAEKMSKTFKGKVISVKGNCDFNSAGKSELLEELGGKKVFITHGHRYDVKYGLTRLMFKAQETEADIVLFGHTHISVVEYEEGVWFVNPGSAAQARDRQESVALIRIDEEGINVDIEPI